MSINLNLSIGYQNVDGLHSGLLGCKLDNEIELSCDIEILSETWSNCENCSKANIPGYVLVNKPIEPEKKGKKGRKSGGIKIYCKTFLKDKNLIKVFKSTDKYVWFNVDKSLFHEWNENLKVCAIYSQPSLSAYYRESVWDDLESDIADFSSDNTPICVIGDMNARTGDRLDFVTSTDRYMDAVPSKLLKVPRKSCDKILNKVGEKVLSLCKSYDLQIANGRSHGDFLGNFTHHNKNTGQSTVDLALLSDPLFPKMDDFKILPQNVYSDHCKIVLTLKNFRPVIGNDDYEWQPLQKEYKWDSENSPLKYTEALNSQEIRTLIESCNQHIQAGLIESSGTLLQEIFQRAAELSLELKPKRTLVSKKNAQTKKKSKQKKWFDNECLRMKKATNRLANMKHRCPWNNNLRESHRHALKLFKKICLKKKEIFWNGEYDKLDLLNNNSDFWEEWKVFGENKSLSNYSDLEGRRTEEFYEKLFTKIEDNINSVMEKVHMADNNFLNQDFVLEELKYVIDELIKKKAVGKDRIANEFLQQASPALLQLLLNYMNLNIRTGLACKNWCFGLISLIHKEGPKDDPNNYRGICIMNALLKVLCTLLNKRIPEYCEEQNLINIAQIGFEKNSRASDHVLTLKSVVNKYVCDQKGKALYTCFVDFQKAFDSVWHEALFRKLENKGINGNFLNIIKNIYDMTECAVKINGKLTKQFKYEKGVLQGNPLSPLLFNLFINDIFEAIRNESPITLDGVNKLNALMYADDLIIMATSPDELQKSLDGLTAYCQKWKLNVNIKKTKCLTFSKGTNVKKHQFKINNKLVENTKEYKYLGVTINSRNCSFSPTVAYLSAKATRALYAITSKLPIRSSPTKTLLKLFDFCVAPILTYGSEIWAAYMDHDWRNWDTTPIERCHSLFLKRILGVNRSTTNVMARSELGRMSLQERIAKRNIKYIKYVASKNQNSLVWHALNYEHSQSSNRRSIFSIFQRHEGSLLENVVEIENVRSSENENDGQLTTGSEQQPSLIEKIKSIKDDKLHGSVKDCFKKIWLEQIDTFSKATLFKSFKDKVVIEKYLLDIKNRKHRVSLSKLRLSDHCLMIEQGRHCRPITPREERLCPHCPDLIEDEEHFLIRCSAYERTHFFEKIREKTPQFGNLDDHNKFIFLMSQEDPELTKELAVQVHKWFMARLEYKAQAEAT